MRDLLSIGTSRGCEMIGTGLGLGLAGYRLPSGPQFAPDQLTGLKLWLDASDAQTLYQSNGGSLAAADGDPVGYWSDKSGSLNHSVQASGTSKPALKVAVKNGKNVIRFDGVNDFLDCGTGLGKPSNYTIFSVFKVANTLTRMTVCASGDSVGGTATSWGAIDISQGGVAGSLGYGFGDGTNASFGRTAGSIVSGGTFAQVTAKYTSGQTFQAFRRNGSDISIVTVVASSASSVGGTAYKFVLGQYGEYPGVYLNGDIGELIVFNQSLTQSDVQKVETYLNSKWSIY
jgi:hypothetical protein